MASSIVPLEKWMEAALYHPDRGYYPRNITTVGRGGDFSTTATLTPSFGRAVAKWICDEQQYHGSERELRDVIEIGAGDGSLMASVLRHRTLQDKVCRKTRYHIVEASPILRAKQRARLGRKVRWHESVYDAMEYCKGEALIYSNELVDAFPAVQLRWSGRSWDKVWLDPSSKPPKEVYLPFLEPDDISLSGVTTKDWEFPPREGHRIELHLMYRQWLKRWIHKWRQGSMLTIDYGDTAPRLQINNPPGTLRAYFKHYRIMGEEVYNNPGRMDLTVDVNFSDLRNWGEEEGLKTVALQTQREFLLQRLPGIDESSDRALQMILDPQGAGTAFLALQQRRERKKWKR